MSFNYYFYEPEPVRPIVLAWRKFWGVVDNPSLVVKGTRFLGCFVRRGRAWIAVNPRFCRTVGGVVVGGLASYAAYRLFRRFLPIHFRTGTLKTVYAAAHGMMIGESSRPGSYEQAAVKPKEQLEVFTLDEPAVFVGFACRMQAGDKDVLVMPEHVLASASLGQDKLMVKGCTGSVALDVSEAISIETDVVSLAVTATQCSKIGAPVVTPAIMSEEGSVSVAGPKNRGTVAKLERSELFGKFVYRGTTLPGYSGALYRVTKPVAMHLSGGAVNLAISLSYVQVLLNRRFNCRGEDTSDYLAGLYKRKVKVRAIRNPNDWDDVFLDVAGRTVCVAGKDFEKVFGQHASEKLTGSYGYVDYESAFRKNPAARGDSEERATDRSGKLPLDTLSMEGLSKLSKKQKHSLKKQIESYLGPKEGERQS